MKTNVVPLHYQCSSCKNQGIPTTKLTPNVCGGVLFNKIFDLSDTAWQVAYKWHIIAKLYQELEDLEKIIKSTPILETALAGDTYRTSLIKAIDYQLYILDNLTTNTKGKS